MAERSPEYLAAYAEHAETLRGPDGLYALEGIERETGATPQALVELRAKREEIWRRIHAAA